MQDYWQKPSSAGVTLQYYFRSGIALSQTISVKDRALSEIVLW